MPHANWKGNITFGLVNIPIVLYSAEDPSASVSFKQIDKKTGAKIKYKRVNADTEEEVPWEQIGKGYAYSKDVILPVEEGELKRVAGENAHTIAIEAFVDKKSIDFLNIDRAYFLVPDKKGDKGYVILREALNRSNKIGIAKVIITTKEYLAAVAPYENALVIYLLHYDEEMRKLSDFNIPSEDLRHYKINDKEIKIAMQLINSMTEKWNPKQYKDEYREAVEEWIEHKMKKLPTTQMSQRGPKTKPSDKVVNFVDLLKKSLETNKPQKAISKKRKATKVKGKARVPSRVSYHNRSATKH